MYIKVYQVRRPTFRHDPNAKKTWMMKSECVAVIPDCGDLNRAFDLTNHIDKPWWENEGVERTRFYGFRSTSVGDFLVKVKTANEALEAVRKGESAFNEVWEVANFGYNKVE